MIPHSRPWITPADTEAVVSALLGEMLGQGARNGALEKRLSEWVGIDHPGVTAGSGSAAIALSLAALGCGPGAEVVLPTYVCGSVLDAVVSCGAAPVLCDSGPDWVITVESIRPRVSTRTRAIIVPHLYGIFADVPSMKEFGVPIIEDAAQALDLRNSRPAAGDIVTFSFHPTKCLTSGEGGMAAARDPNLADRMRELRDGTPSQGLAPRMFTPLSDLSAALCLSQLDRYDAGVVKRRSIAEIFRTALKAGGAAGGAEGVEDPSGRLKDRSMFFRFPVRVPRLGIDELGPRFLEAGIAVRRGVDSLQHRRMGLSDSLYPEAVRHFETTVSLPIYPSLSNEERDHVASTAARLLAPGH